MALFWIFREPIVMNTGNVAKKLTEGNGYEINVLGIVLGSFD